MVVLVRVLRVNSRVHGINLVAALALLLVKFLGARCTANFSLEDLVGIELVTRRCRHLVLMIDRTWLKFGHLLRGLLLTKSLVSSTIGYSFVLFILLLLGAATSCHLRYSILCHLLTELRDKAVHSLLRGDLVLCILLGCGRI